MRRLDFYIARNNSFSFFEMFRARRTRIDSQTSKFGSNVSTGAGMGLDLHTIENLHVEDCEGHAGRRIAELRLLECFSGRNFQHRTVAERRGLLALQRGRVTRRYGAMD